MGIEIVLEGAFSGAGNTLPAMVITVPLNLAGIPLAYALATGFGLGINGYGGPSPARVSPRA